MNSGAGEPGSAPGTAAALDSLIGLANGLNATLHDCALDPRTETVHRLRTGSRRIQAVVETMLSATRAPKAPRHAARAWLRQLKQLRRAAGPVRDLDVHRGIVEKWMEKDGAAGGPEGAAIEPPGGEEKSALIRQARAFADWLKSERLLRAEFLLKQIRRRRRKLEGAQSAFLAAGVDLPKPRSRASPALVALRDFARLAAAEPWLDAENLHDFRKAVKKARYVAETGGEEPAARSVAKALKRVQDAIGDWHDWVRLSEEAKEALGEGGRELAACFEGEASAHFGDALRTTETIRGRLMGEWMAARGRAPKLPPRSAGTVKKRSQRQSPNQSPSRGAA